MPPPFQQFLLGVALLLIGGLGTLSFITISTAQEVKNLKEDVVKVAPVVQDVAAIKETLRLQEKDLDMVQKDIKEVLRLLR